MALIFLLTTTTWLSLTLFVDFFLLPQAFQNYPREVAVTMGQWIFPFFNKVEIGCAILMLVTFFFSRLKRKKLFLLFLGGLFLIPFIYEFVLTAQMQSLTEQIVALKKQVELTGLASLVERRDFLHHLYRYFDAGKIVLLFICLLTFFIHCLRQKRKRL